MAMAGVVASIGRCAALTVSLTVAAASVSADDAPLMQGSGNWCAGAPLELSGRRPLDPVAHAEVRYALRVFDECERAQMLARSPEDEEALQACVCSMKTVRNLLAGNGFNVLDLDARAWAFEGWE